MEMKFISTASELFLLTSQLKQTWSLDLRHVFFGSSSRWRFLPNVLIRSLFPCESWCVCVQLPIPVLKNRSKSISIRRHTIISSSPRYPFGRLRRYQASIFSALICFFIPLFCWRLFANLLWRSSCRLIFRLVVFTVVVCLSSYILVCICLGQVFVCFLDWCSIRRWCYSPALLDQC